jgi:hypothetical protein
MVVFIFTVIVGLGLILFYRVSINSIEDSDMAYRENKFKQLIDVVPNLPELRLSELGVESEACIDLIKAQIFRDMQDEYELGFKKIEIIGSNSVVLYEKKKAADSVRKYNSPICVYDPYLDKFEMAKLEVEWYV